MLAKPDLAAIRRAILTHYVAHARLLPWRQPPGGTVGADPYRVWLSEIMLQQTTVVAATPYFERFVARWPTVAALAAAPDADVLAAWAGLGYYSRARNLIACARCIVDQHSGRFPCHVAALQSLPGVGRYTAAAINAIAFGGAAVPVDANIERVVARLFAIAAPLPAGRRAIEDAAAALWPDQGGGDFAQALMDLGASICTARSPRCTVCPLADHCAAHAANCADTLPVKAPRRDRPRRFGRASWHVRGTGSTAQLWLVRRPARGLLGGMRALPGSDWGPEPVPPGCGGREIGTVRHIFTHLALLLTIDRHDHPPDSVGEGEWWPISRLDEAGLPTLYRRAAELALKEF